MKLAAGDGQPVWQKLIDGPAHGDDRGWFIEVGPDDHPVVAGVVTSGIEEASFHTAKLRSSDGFILWSRTLPGAIFNLDDRSGALATLDNGDVVICGRTWSVATSYDAVLHRFSAFDGGQVWHTQYNSGGATPDDARAMVRNVAGDRLMVAGVRSGDFMALSFRASDGQLEWSAGYNGPPGWYDSATCMVEGPGGEVILGGYSSGATTGWDATAVAFDPADGQQLWVVRHDAGFNETDEFSALAIGPAGEFFAGGYTYTLGTYSDMLTIYFQTEVPVSVDPAEPADPSWLRAGPNPFRDCLAVELALPAESGTVVEVFDPRGRRLSVLGDGVLPAGQHRFAWDGCDGNGAPAAEGVYLVRAESGGRTATQKVVRIR